MTLEELKQLKKGEEIFIRARYKSVLGDGDVLFSHSVLNAYDEVVRDDAYTHPSNVILPPPAPKYDPCREFKKGDKVKRRTVDGRTDQEISEGIELAVICGEDKYGNVRVQSPNGISIVTKSVFLELVTPVEELEPYIVKKYHHFYAVERINNLADRPATYDIDFHPHAKEAAEAECARLNAEHRKNQK